MVSVTLGIFPVAGYRFLNWCYAYYGYCRFYDLHSATASWNMQGKIGWASGRRAASQAIHWEDSEYYLDFPKSDCGADYRISSIVPLPARQSIESLLFAKF